MTLFSIMLVLFLIMDPFGNISSYLSLMSDTPVKRRKWILFREMLIALAVMLFFNYLGEYIFIILGLSETTVRLSSGIILFLIAIKILFPSDDSIRANLPKGEPFIIPLAIPLIVGPSLMATIMLYARMESSQALMIYAIILSTLAVGFVLFFAEGIKKVLTQNGLTACERLMGMVLVLIAIQRFLEGIILFCKTYPNPT